MDWDSDDFVLGLGLGFILILMMSLDIILTMWFTTWLEIIPFDPWLILIPTALFSIILALFSGWNDDFIVALIIIIFIFAIPLILITSPLWIPGYFINLTYNDRRNHQKRLHDEKETNKKLNHFNDLLSNEKEKEAHQFFEETLWDNLKFLPKQELINVFSQIAELSPQWGLHQLIRASNLGKWSVESNDIEKVRNTSLIVLRNQLDKPEKIFSELSYLMSLNVEILEVLEKVIQEKFENVELGDICRVYTLLLAVPDLVNYDNDKNLVSFLVLNKRAWPENWMSKIFPSWSGWNDLPSSKYSFEYEMEMNSPEMFKNMPSEMSRIKAIQDIAIEVFNNASELPYGKERSLTFNLISDMSKVRFERDMIALFDQGNELLSISNESTPYFNLSKKLEDLIRVCSLVYRSERYGLLVTDQLAFYASALGILQNISQTIRDISPPDEWFLRYIVESWLEIITTTIAKKKANADLLMELDKIEPSGSDYLINLNINNQGGGIGEQVRVQFDPDKQLEDKGIHAQKNEFIIEFIRGNQNINVNFRLSVDHPGTFRLPFKMEWNDLEKDGKDRFFADEASFAVKERAFIQLDPNPYIAGPPLKTNKMFYGREEIFHFVKQNLPAGEQNNIIVLYGERRTGKTSLLYQLQHRLPESNIPIFIDLQGAPKMTATAFWHYLAVRIHHELEKSGHSIKKPELDNFDKDPFNYFCYDFLNPIYEVIQKKNLVLLIDEFDVLENEVKALNLPQSTFGNIRHLMQHTSLCFIFAGTYDITKVGADYWSVLFNTALWKRIELLDRTTFEELVQVPMKGYFELDDYALDKIWEMTAGHPFFVQLLCRELFNYGNDKRIILRNIPGNYPGYYSCKYTCTGSNGISISIKTPPVPF